MLRTITTVLFSTLMGCSYMSAHDNREAILTKLQDGMTKSQVTTLLGEPYKLDHPEPNIEILYYETDPLAGSFCLQFTPVRLKSNVVAQWGDAFCKEPIATKTTGMDPHLKQ